MEKDVRQCSICLSSVSLTQIQEKWICHNCLLTGFKELTYPWKNILTELVEKYSAICLHCSASDDPEDVHEARVTGRKIRAILEFLGVPKKHEILLAIKQIHHILNKVREIDVFLIEMRKESESNTVYSEMEKIFTKKRKKLQKSLTDEIPLILNHSYFHKVHTFLHNELLLFIVRFNTEKAINENENKFTQLVREYHQCVELEGKMAPNSIKALHSVRIQSKTLRYIFYYINEINDGSFQNKVDFYKNLQNHFGEINDVQDWLYQIDKYDKRLTAPKSDIEAIKHHLNTRLKHLIENVDLSSVLTAVNSVQQTNLDDVSE